MIGKCKVLEYVLSLAGALDIIGYGGAVKVHEQINKYGFVGYSVRCLPLLYPCQQGYT